MFDPIAIVGQACLLPGADSPEQLWQLIKECRTSLASVPPGRWRASRDRMLSTATCSTDKGGFVTDFDFEHEFDHLDPIVRWLLHVGRRALEDARIKSGDLRAGAIVGNLAYPTESLVDLAQSVYLSADGSSPRCDALNRFSAGLPVHLLCRELGLKAGGFALDAACASSLYAIKLASDWLHMGRADVMLAGAVNRADSLLIHSGFTALRALSPTGQSRPFHRDADGLVPAEGAALLVLKRLTDAERDENRILAVIRGIGLSNDGRGSGILTPSAEGQVRAMEAAYANSNLRPSDISLIECHATGTSVGDSVELQSMSKVFRDVPGLPIGSLKSNLGHLITVSGVAGIIKIIQAMHHGVRPATLNAVPATGALAGTPFRLLEVEESWPGPRRAAINSFGFGGNNAHLLLEEYVGVLHVAAVYDRRPSPMAVVAIAARAGNGRSTQDFISDLVTGRSRIQELPDGSRGALAQEVHVPSQGLIFPPNDLARTLAQQNLLLEVTAEALKETKSLPNERTSAFIGMACDAESTRTVLRLVLPDLIDSSHQLEDAMDAPIDAARVVGCMPNIPANRLNRQFGLGGPSFTIAAEELSGIRALGIAINALENREIDAAIVGASDLCVEPVHQSAMSELPESKRVPGDGACVLILKRIDDAVRDEDTIHGLVSTSDASTPTLDGSELSRRVLECFGHVHAASGLLDVVAGVASLDRGTLIDPLLPGAEPHRLHVNVEALGGQTQSVSVIEADRLAAVHRPVVPVPEILTYAAEDLASLRSALESERPSAGSCRLAIVASSAERSERLHQARVFLQQIELGQAPRPPDGVFFHRTGVDGEMAFVFTGAVAAYPGMGRDILVTLPDLARRVGKRCEDLNRYAGWVYRNTQQPTDFERLCGSSLLCQVHTEFTRDVLRLKPHAAIGLSSGETNALYALGAWDGFHKLLREIEECGLYTIELGGSAKAVHTAWAERGITGTRWGSYWISAPVDEVKPVVEQESAVHITIINTPNDVVIGGDLVACERVVSQIGAQRAVPLGSEFAAHCPEVRPAATLWRRLHHRPTIQPAGVRFYSNALGRAYALNADSVADALTAQALETIDFPRTIRQAWEDGVRVFIEHGPRSQCTQSIRSILGDRPQLALALDAPPRSSLRQLLHVSAELWAAGIDVDIAELRARLGFDRPKTEERPALVFPAHPPAPLRPVSSHVFVMEPAPQLAPLLIGERTTVAKSSPAPKVYAAAAVHDRIATVHREHISSMARLDEAYQEMQGRLLKALTTGGGSQPRAIERKFNRQDLEIHASGLISKIFGATFKGQDGFRRQVRMPEPPLLLADRVASLIGEPGSMSRGRIVTETDVRANSWYLHQGRMPAGITIEAGQADLMLISWLGVDALNKGERVYRLLGCDLSFSGSLPRVGETLRYDIQVDGHASHGGVRMFFFHYDCTVGGKTLLTVRNGQAGFFTDAELAGSDGVLWSAETTAPTANGKVRHETSQRVTSFRSFDSTRMRDFAAGRTADCFGPGFERSFCHTRSPHIQDGRMQLLQTVTSFEPMGGPWSRGYLRAEWNVRPDDWFFEGHFKNDPCMPGTLMFEACLQSMAFYMTALGFTLERDGWRFEPVPEEVYSLRCRGQVTPTSKQIVYEVFVDEISNGPLPALFADVLCTVDGLKAFHCHRLGLRLVPDWPLEELSIEQSANVPFDHASLMACALGRPSNAFGNAFSRFNSPIKVPRLPGPPYHFMSRVVRAEGAGSKVGAIAEVEYDVPADAWYFSENGHPVMPISVLVEVLLQPCGWLASFAGTWLDVQHDIFFRNLDGSGVVHSEVGPNDRVLRTQTTLTSFSQMGPMSITAFKIRCHAGDRLVFEGDAVFGHFPAEALRNQAGLPATSEELRWMNESSTSHIDLESFINAPFLGRDKLRMIDRITGYWPSSGDAGLGRMRAEKDIDPRQWFFKAHFFSDPVQPGSLGLEAIFQTLQTYMLARGMHSGMRSPRFEPIALSVPVSWTYRGQVLPENKRETILLEVTSQGRDERGFYANGVASLWVDGTKIYAFPSVGMRVVDGEETGGIEVLDPATDTWLTDHCPTYTVPVLPMMSVVDRLARAAHQSAPHRRVVEMTSIRMNGWIAFGAGARRLKTDVVHRDVDNVGVSLSVWRDAPHAEMSRYDVMAEADVRLADVYPPAPPQMPSLTNTVLAHDPPEKSVYEAGELFHRPGFHFLTRLSRTHEGSSFLLDSKRGSVPPGFWNQALFDGITHGIPNENLRLWSDRIAGDQVGYPSRIVRLRLFADPPQDGQSSCEVRFRGFYQDQERFPQFAVHLIRNGQVWVEMELVYALFDKGPLGAASGVDRRRFLEQKIYVPGLMLGRYTEAATTVTPEDVFRSDWLPGTIDAAFGLKSGNRVSELAIKQHLARNIEVHPTKIIVSADMRSARCRHYPLTHFTVDVDNANGVSTVRDSGSQVIDCGDVRRFWKHVSGVDEWPIADLHIGLIERFIRRVEIIDPDGFEAIRGRPAMFLANHQVAIESILFNVIVSSLSETVIKVIAKIEHRNTWIGRLIDLARRYPRTRQFEPILFFDRADPRSLFELFDRFRGAQSQGPVSLMAHVEGTRAKSSRTPVTQVSSVLVDLALEMDLPIVPVRFTGGLPAEPVEERLEFPFGFGRQDIRIGSPIHSAALRSLSLADRSRLVVQAINALTPSNEQPLPPAFSSFDSERSVLVESLRSAGHICSESEMILAAIDGGPKRWANDNRGVWLDEFSMWLREAGV